MSKKSGKSKQRKTPSTRRPAVANPTTSRSPEQAQGNAGLILWAGFGASILLFWYFHVLTLNQMTDLSNGVPMPDQLVGGYDAGFMEILRTSMDADARGQLNYLHKTAGLLFPLFFALTTMLAVNLNVPRGTLRWGLWAVPMLFAVADLWENAAIDAVLAADRLDPAAVALASTLTVGRWVLLVGTAVVAAVVLVRGFVRTFKAKWGEAGLS